MRTRIITIITLLLSTPMVIAQKSMDEIDRESFAAKLSPMEVKGIQMTETGNIPLGQRYSCKHLFGRNLATGRRRN